jgi:hypothetical protein
MVGREAVHDQETAPHGDRHEVARPDPQPAQVPREPAGVCRHLRVGQAAAG